MGAVTVGYQTVSAGATPGLDYVSTSGTLSFAAGATTATIHVPVLADTWDNQDRICKRRAQFPDRRRDHRALMVRRFCRIIDVDPDDTPPEVSEPFLGGHGESITSLSVAFTAPLEQPYAMESANYQLVAPGSATG